MTTPNEALIRAERETEARRLNILSILKLGMEVNWIYGPNPNALAVIKDIPKVSDPTIELLPRDPLKWPDGCDKIAWWALRPAGCVKSKEL